ncbi:MAG TPA: GNAT family N-acetyltransferase [Acidothermaceae bacterium]|jgi:ribosomal protein S18 acetylase RimI-like enzyme
MSGVELTPIDPAERARSYATLVLAFVTDPAIRWLYPDADQYLTHFPRFLAAFGGRAFDEKTAWRLRDFSSVALWLPPGAEPDGDEIVAVLTESVATAKHEELFSVFEQMDATHPTYPHWYLPWFGVDPARQGQGVGSVLMTQCLIAVDADKLPAYLETPNPRNISFYERHGFEVVARTQVGDAPVITMMLRPAR